MGALLNFSELQEIAREVIARLQTIPEFKDTNLAVIGGGALVKYLPKARWTKDIDFLIDIPGITADDRLSELPSGIPQLVKAALLRNFATSFKQLGPLFCFTTYHNDREIYTALDFIPKAVVPYIPSAATPLSEINLNNLPFISVPDLILFRIHSCGMRPYRIKREADAREAAELTKLLTEEESWVLARDQKLVLRDGIGSVIQYGTKGMDWWENTLPGVFLFQINGIPRRV